MNEYLIFSAAWAVCLFVTLVLFYGAWRLRRRLYGLPFAVIGVITFVTGVYFFWYTHRPLPANEQRTLFEGVTYTREIRTQPVPMIIHVVSIDLDTPGLRFFVTPEGENVPARTTSQFLNEFELQLAINGDFFDPWRDYGFWDYYPHVSDPVNVRGLAAFDNVVYTRGYAPPESYSTIYFTPDHHISFNEPTAEIAAAISGNAMLVADGLPIVVEGSDSYLYSRHPRTAIGVDESGRMLLLILVDGRQPSYSDGATLPELTDIALQYGAYHVLNLDGGGSTTLVIEGEDGTAQGLNSPIHNRIPGRERPIANHLGLYVENTP